MHKLALSISQLGGDTTDALRSLARRPLVSVLAIVSLALAIAGNGVVFSMVDTWLFHSWDYEDPDRLVFVWQSKAEELFGQTPVSPANFVDWKERSSTLRLWTGLRAAPMALMGTETAETVNGGEISANFFELIGVEAAAGRLFGAAEEVAGRDRVAVITWDLWQRRFGADAGLVGGTIELRGEPHTLLGVLPQSFEFLFAPAEVFVPLVLEGQALSRGRRDLLALARLQPGATKEQAAEEMQGIARRLEAEHPGDNRGYSAKVLSLPEQFPGDTNVKLFALLQGLMLVVLLIACINIANLLLAQGQGRQKELAVRSALGAERQRLVRQLLVESLLLAAAGGLLGLALAGWGIRSLFLTFANLLPKSFIPALDPRVVVFTLVVAVGAGVLFGLAPALQASRPNLAQLLGEGGRGGVGGRRRRLLVRGLVVAQMAGALIMLSGAGLLVRSFLAVEHADPGFKQEKLLTFQLTLPEGRYPDDERLAAFYTRLDETLEALPGVEAVAAVSVLPRTPVPPSVSVNLAGESQAEEDAASATAVTVGPGYRRALDVALLHGRDFAPSDRLGTPPVVLVNRAMAQRFWPAGDPLGARLTIDTVEREVVGVIGDVQQDLLRPTADGFAPVLYLPHTQAPSRSVGVLVRGTGDPKALVPAVRAAVQGLDRDLAPSQELPLEDYVAQFFVGMDVINKVMLAAGLVALVLAAVGIYGVLAYSVAQRTREIGLRMAMGADRGQVLRQFTREGMTLALVGFAIGLPVVWLQVKLLRSTLEGLARISPGVTVGIALVLLVVALAASLVPARRAARLDPLAALRED